MSSPIDIRVGDLEAGEGEPLYEGDPPPVSAYASAPSALLASSWYAVNSAL